MMKAIFGSLILLCTLLGATQAFAQSQSEVDENTLKEYFEKNHINATRTASGLYYVITQKGKGENAREGQDVSVNYIGRFMGGKVFDATIDETGKLINQRDPINFTLGAGQVINGWDEGIQLLNPGSKATFFIPSALGYGAVERGPIPANSILIFDVELIAVH